MGILLENRGFSSFSEVHNFINQILLIVTISKALISGHTKAKQGIFISTKGPSHTKEAI